MLFQKINREDPEKVFIICENKEGGVLSHGDVVEWDLDNTMGLSVELADGAATALVAGVVQGKALGDTSDAADGDPVIVQVYGYHPAVLTDGGVTAADPLMSTNAGTADTGTEGTQTLGIFGVALTTDSGSPTTSEAIIRCM